MSDKTINGSCLCGKVSYSLKGHSGIFQYCHCSRCRKFTGSAFSPNILISPNDFVWTKGHEYVSRFELQGARHFATSFCSHCGSSLPWLTQSGKAMVVPAGTLDENPQLYPSQNVYYASRAPWFEEPGSLPHYDELPPKNP